MSGFWDQPQSPNQIATTFESGRSQKGGQGHDRIHGDSYIPGISPTMAMTSENVVELDITLGQKMVSAMSGSLLTSLLGN
jgi:solute carrier family 25, member 39/40